MNKGRLIIISGPSGSGKDTVMQKVLKKHPEIRFSISSITRDMREGEVQDEKYHFISREEFETAIRSGEMLEYNVYLNNYYGTPKKPVDDAISDGAEIIVEVDINGAKNIKKQYPEALGIFVIPPTYEALRTRLTGRGTESAEQIYGRLKIAISEIEEASKLDLYDYILINDDLDVAVEELISIIVTDRSKKERKINILNEVLENAKSSNR